MRRRNRTIVPSGCARAACWAALLLIAPPVCGATDEAIQVRVDPAHDRQVIDGFGGSLAYWGYDADDTSVRYAFDDLGATLVRVPGDLSSSGSPDQYRAALARVSRIAPRAKILVSFWQPRSAAKPDAAEWLDPHPAGGLALRPAHYGAWADAIVARLKVMRDEWGANIVAVSPQNEPNFSTPAWPTCRWDPPA